MRGRPSKQSGARGTPAIQGRNCGCTPVEGRWVGVGGAVDENDEFLIFRLYEAKRHGILDHRAQRIEESEYVNKNDGCGRYGGQSVLATDSKLWIIRLVCIPSCVQAATSMSCALSRCDIHTGREGVVSPLQTCRIHQVEQQTHQLGAPSPLCVHASIQRRPRSSPKRGLGWPINEAKEPRALTDSTLK